jgi:hypothetical protein
MYDMNDSDEHKNGNVNVENLRYSDINQKLTHKHENQP